MWHRFMWHRFVTGVFATGAATALLTLAISLLTFNLVKAEEADVILKDGRTLHGDVSQTDTHVIIRTPNGPVRIDKNDVLRITSDATPDDEYREMVAVLDGGDVAGHFAVAEWAAQIERWDLVIKRCRYILMFNRRHADARRLLEHARRRQALRIKTDVKKALTTRSSRPAAARPALAPPPRISKRDMLRLKLHELPTGEPAERVRVRFKRKRIGAGVLTRFATEMRNREGYTRDWERRFRRAKPYEQLRQIVAASGVQYADEIDVAGDTAVFRSFRRNVLPLLVRSCAKTGCHGGSTARVFRFPNTPRLGDEYVYGSFLILDALETRYGALIDRELPETSALLGFMLPQAASSTPHPQPKQRRRKVNPVLRGEADRNYARVLDWIASLRTPRPRYELDYKMPAWLPPRKPSVLDLDGANIGPGADGRPAKPQPTSKPTAGDGGAKP